MTILIAARSFRPAKSLLKTLFVRSLSTRPLPTVQVESYSPSASRPTSATEIAPGANNLPNDVRLPNSDLERSSLYQAESARSMAGYEAGVRTDWTKGEVKEIFDLPFHELMYRAATVHRMFWDPKEVQQCTLLSIRRGDALRTANTAVRVCTTRHL